MRRTVYTVYTVLSRSTNKYCYTHSTATTAVIQWLACHSEAPNFHLQTLSVKQQGAFTDGEHACK